MPSNEEHRYLLQRLALCCITLACFHQCPSAADEQVLPYAFFCGGGTSRHSFTSRSARLSGVQKYKTRILCLLSYDFSTPVTIKGGHLPSLYRDLFGVKPCVRTIQYLIFIALKGATFSWGCHLVALALATLKNMNHDSDPISPSGTLRRSPQ